MNATQVLLVNPAVGNDAVADGSDRAPFKTIAHVLQVAQPGTTILLSPGTYSQETGETFPLRLKPDVTVQGSVETRGQGIVIQGSGFFLSPTFARQKVAIVGADRAILAGVTVKNPDAQGYGVWIESTSPAILDSTFTESGHDGISVTGSGSPLIRNNYFYQNGANGITIYGTSRAEVRENIFEQTGFAINVNQKAAPLLIGNRITQNKDGIVVQANAQPIVRDNSVDGNTRDGLVAIAQSRPNLGTATLPGGNSFRNNGQFDVNAKGLRQTIPAFGNDLHKTIGTLDLTGTSPEVSTSSGTPMPWSLSAVPRSPVSADQSTAANGKSAANRVQKPAIGKPSIAMAAIAATNQATADTIPFGQRLVSDRSVGTVAQTIPQALPRPSATSEPVGDGISAASFPVPIVQPVRSLSRPIVPLAAVALPSSASPEPEFPVPSALSGRQTQSPPRAMQVVRVAIAPPTPVQRVLQRTQAPHTSQPPAMTLRPVSLQDSAPIAVIPSSRAIATRVSTGTRAIEIPVPAPEARSTPSPMPRRATVATSSISAQSGTLASAGLLPVPNPNAPIGVVGSLPNVYHAQQNASSKVFASRAALGLRYRVVVEADDSKQAQLRTTFPNAFRTSIKGRSLVQVGAFGDRTKADQLMQTLSSQGVQAMVETLE
ncbi:MAG: DUF1565 domain-containing protein [Tildeniella nuda ZEHNDER 1965/U140]|jgi:parallel beta-helix repeat protein|nr:DUF1565 domain-containing protein [Tildeniella nuda ZEHNDER 1965/U140]